MEIETYEDTDRFKSRAVVSSALFFAFPCALKGVPSPTAFAPFYKLPAYSLSLV